MAHDPARAKKRTLAEARQAMRQACLEIPCRPVVTGTNPPCAICVHEGKIRKEP